MGREIFGVTMGVIFTLMTVTIFILTGMVFFEFGVPEQIAQEGDTMGHLVSVPRTIQQPLRRTSNAVLVPTPTNFYRAPNVNFNNEIQQTSGMTTTAGGYLKAEEAYRPTGVHPHQRMTIEQGHRNAAYERTIAYPQAAQPQGQRLLNEVEQPARHHSTEYRTQEYRTQQQVAPSRSEIQPVSMSRQTTTNPRRRSLESRTDADAEWPSHQWHDDRVPENSAHNQYDNTSRPQADQPQQSRTEPSPQMQVSPRDSRMPVSASPQPNQPRVKHFQWSNAR